MGVFGCFLNRAWLALGMQAHGSHARDVQQAIVLDGCLVLACPSRYDVWLPAPGGATAHEEEEKEENGGLPGHEWDRWRPGLERILERGERQGIRTAVNGIETLRHCIYRPGREESGMIFKSLARPPPY